MLVQALIEDELTVITAHEEVQRQRAVVQQFEEKVVRQKAALGCLGVDWRKELRALRPVAKEGEDSGDAARRERGADTGGGG